MINNIYLFENIQSFINNCNNRLVYKELQKTDLYNKLVSHTLYLPSDSHAGRRLWHLEHGKDIPTCTECNNDAQWYKDNKRYQLTCSKSCASEQRMNKMRKTLGVDNPSQLQSVKDKKKQTCLTKYGVDNVSKDKHIKDKIGSKISKIRIEKYGCPHDTVDGMTWKQYDQKARDYAASQYKIHNDTLDPNGLRSIDFHVDHLFSVREGFNNHVPIATISDISNLQLKTATVNLSKSCKSEKTLSRLYEDYKKGVINTPLL